MRVRCPECSREYNVAEKNLGKQLKCLCGTKFSAEPFLTTEEQPEIDTRFYEDETKDEDFSLVSGEMNDFISNLKQKRKSIDTDLKEESGEIKISEDMFNPPSLEISEGSLERKRIKQEAAAAKLEEETTVSSKEEIENRQSPKAFAPHTPPNNEVPAFEAIFPEREDFHDERSLSKRVSSVVSQADKRVMMVAASLFIIALSIVFASVNVFEQEVKNEDPYLSKLLAPKAGGDTPKMAPLEPPADNQPPTKKKLPPAKQIGASKKVAKPKNKISKKAKEKPLVSVYSDLYSASLYGDFENVVRLGSQHENLEPEAQALFLEALSHRAGGNMKRQQQISGQIQAAIRASTTANALRRAQVAQIAIMPSQESDLYHQAVEVLKNLSLTRSKDPFVYAYLGLAYFRLGQNAKAHRAWNEAQNLSTRYQWVLIQQYDLYVLEKKYDLAIATAIKLEKVPNSKTDALKRMARIRSTQRKYQAAEELYVKAIQLKDSAELRLERGLNLMNLSLKTATTQFQHGLRLTKNSRLKRDLYFSLGQVLCRQANYEEADRAYRHSFLQDKTHVRALFEGGSCAYRAKLYSRSAKSYETILKVQPKNAEAWYSYGIALSQSKKVKAAAGALERSVKLKPTYEAHYHLSLVLLQLGRKKEASTHAYRAYRLNPTSKSAKALLSKLQ